jgi:adenylate kinase
MSDRPPDLIIIGPPGSGKSTFATALAERLGLVHINPGTQFRHMAAEESATGRKIRDVMAEGGLVPGDVTDEIVRESLNAVPPEKGIVLEGYPRDAAQADTLRRLLAESGRLRPRPLVLRLEAPAQELLKRLRRRRDVEGRSDDSEDVIAHRLSEYDAETARLVDALSDWGEVVAIDGARPVEAVTTEIVERLRTSHAR